MSTTRADGRTATQLRPVSLELDWQTAADASVLYRAGKTVVLCTASVDSGVKDFLRGKGTGWVTAEYLMHPRAGGRRQSRDGFNGRPLSGRSHEIARLIGRSLRAAVDLSALGERTLSLDCDVLQADGGTRTASITGAMVALTLALHRLDRREPFARPPLRELIAAVSAGLHGDRALLDLCYTEDSAAEMDLNVVATASGALVELQCTSESSPVQRSTVDELVNLALAGVASLGAIQRESLASAGIGPERLAQLGARP